LGSKRRASDGFDWNALAERVRCTSFIAMNPLKAENRKGERKSVPSTGRIERTRGLTRRRETPKRDRPEAGRPGQRERSQ
jgi:hypothetical protein